MSGNRSRVHVFSLILILALAPMQACASTIQSAGSRTFQRIGRNPRVCGEGDRCDAIGRRP
jgi:hypothetical protein